MNIYLLSRPTSIIKIATKSNSNRDKEKQAHNASKQRDGRTSE